MTDRVRSPLSKLIRNLAAQHRRPLALTYGLTIGENLGRISFPFAIGLAVDGLLAGHPGALAPLIIVWVFYSGIGLARHLYDTRTFTTVYSGLAVDTVSRQRTAGRPGSQIVARVSLSREVVDLLEYEVPRLFAFVLVLLGSIAMLFIYDLWLGVIALGAMVPVGLMNIWWAKRGYRLASGLNARLEREPEIVDGRPLPQVARHFARVRRWRVLSSNAEAATWGVVEIAMIGFTVAVLLRLVGMEAVTAGVIYAVLAYVWDTYECAYDLPYMVEALSRGRDIAERLADGGDIGETDEPKLSS